MAFQTTFKCILVPLFKKKKKSPVPLPHMLRELQLEIIQAKRSQTHAIEVKILTACVCNNSPLQHNKKNINLEIKVDVTACNNSRMECYCM